jgi:hypothetical protein
MIYLGLLLADLYLFFIMYVASMAMLRAHHEKKLNGVLWVLCLPFVALSWVVDVLHNVTVFSVVFCEFPRELTVTERLKRHVTKQTLRGKLARWIADTLLNSFDSSGNHLD